MRRSFSLVLIVLLLLLTALLIIAAPSLVAAKTIQQAQSRVTPLTNQDVIELLQAKLTADEIVAKINSSPANFETSVPEIRALKDAGVSAEIIAAMIQVEKTASISGGANPLEAEQPEQIAVPAGTQVDVEAAYTVSSLDVQSGDLISFRVLVPIKINGVAVIDKGALVTARVLEAKRGGHWGKAGRLSWTMQDVIAVDSTRVPLQSGAEAGSDEINNPGSLRGQPVWGAGNPKKNAKQSSRTRNSVKGVSHGGEIAAKIIIAGALFPPLAPLGLIQGFRRGENAVLPEGKRFLVFVQSDTNVKAARDRVPD